jgi:hypothetical protein
MSSFFNFLKVARILKEELSGHSNWGASLSSFESHLKRLKDFWDDFVQ